MLHLPDFLNVYVFDFFFGDQFVANLGLFNARAAWAVHSGDISAVPLPSTLWLFGSGLFGLIGLVKFKAKTHSKQPAFFYFSQ